MSLGQSGSDAVNPSSGEGHVIDEDATRRRRLAETFLASHRTSTSGALDGVYVIPKDARGEGDAKESRRHLLVVLPSDVRVGTAIYGSKSPTAAQKSAPCRRVLPRSGREGNGLEVPTFFYPTAITYVYRGDLDEFRGRLTNADADPLRRAIRVAFGIGKGRFRDPGVPAESWRGRIVELPKAVAQKHKIDFGVVLTCHEHSIHGYDQIVIPLAVSDPAIDDPEQDVVSDDPVCASLLDTSAPVVWVVPMAFSVHQKRQHLGDTGHVISEGDLRRLEDVLVARFSL